MKRFITMLLAMAICLSLAACGGVAPEHKEILSLLENERYDEAIYKIEELRDAPETNEDGETVTEALDEYQKENLYSTATNFLDNYSPLNSSSSERYFYDNRIGENITCKSAEECFAFIEEILTQLGDYENSKAYLDRIYTVENVLLSTKTTYKDAFDAEHDDGSLRYSYYENGKLQGLSSSYNLYTYISNLGAPPVYEYDENGNVAKITFASGDTVYAVMTYTYENGKIKTESCKKNDGKSFEITYVYDANGNLSEMQNVPNDQSIGFEDTITVKFTYDDAGNLIKESVEGSNNRFQYITYKYENGKLVYKEMVKGDRTEYGASHTVHVPEYTAWEYTYDSEGRIDTVTKLDLGHLDENRNQVDYQGKPVDGSDLDFPRVTKYTYGTFYGVTEE